MRTTAKLWTGLAILIVLAPLGLILPEYFKSGGVWGEWGNDAIKKLVGYTPGGLEKLSTLWSAPLPNYSFQGSQERGLAHLGLATIVCALAGVTAVVLVMWLIGRALSKKGD